ncbi:hypothetical protein SCHPADRAFT_833081 [Schizopora paradoxa]|uniref:SWIM-type domain-containing protein n=1 Tax=Schizopora paradoxa TaxID=27342 RepID=A0A0H2RDW3_9AGAM|nr:hypothetical protein SCHPADRAFT_833081 [Schizopora paradoxa]
MFQTYADVELQVKLTDLSLNEEQKKGVENTYNTKAHFFKEFNKNNAAEQAEAVELLQTLGLDRQSRELPERRWRAVWSTKWSLISGESRRRILFQCLCGYDHLVRQSTERDRAAKAPESKKQPSRSHEWHRKSAYAFTGCLAHVDITENKETGVVDRVVGIIEHNAECIAAELVHRPAVALHEHVYEIAIEQLRAGASISAIASKNAELQEKMAYRGMGEPGPQKYRYHFLPSDHSTLYRKLSRSNGIDPSRLPQYNVHEWLDPESENYNEKIRNGVFHYVPRSDDDDRFEIGIATVEMDEAAWKYGHSSQIILDGTFGVCSERLLLFIVMVIDEAWKGVPVSFLLFSAATGTKATHASYNRAILQKLIRAWKTHLGERSGKGFRPLVAITDTDTKERSALLDVWPSLWLLLCKFHVRQCWTNNRKAVLRESKGSPFWNDLVRDRLCQLEENLLSSVLHADAMKLIEQQRVDLQAITSEADAKKASAAGLKHISYLTQHWMPIPLWSGWSQFGRSHASRLLGVELEGVLPTTNHLESFNAVLKRVHLPRWLRSGHRLRFDSFIHILVTQILPDIYSTRRARQNYDKWLKERFSHLGNAALATNQPEVQSGQTKPTPLCYWPEDAKGEVEGKALIRTGRLSQPLYGASPDIFLSTCASSSAVLSDPAHSRYAVCLHRMGPSSCTCIRFQDRGGACKHMRALRIIVDDWVSTGSVAPMYYPLDMQDALKVNAYFESLSGPRNSQGHPVGGVLVEPPSVPAPPSATALGVLVALASVTEEDETYDKIQEEIVHASGSESDSEDDEQLKSNALNLKPSNLQADALQFQVQSRTEHAARSIMPELHGINNMLGEAALAPTAGLLEFLETINQLSERLSKALTLQQTVINATSDLSSQAVAVPSKPRTVLDNAGASKRLRAPSPERRQVRKQSHAPL